MKLKILTFILTCALSAKTEKYFNENDIPEMIYLDPSTNPCDNFYQFTCGNFAKIHPRPSSMNILDHFTLLENELIQVGREILSNSPSEDDPIALKKAKTAFKSCVNVQLHNTVAVPQLRTIEEFGGMPLLSTSNKTVNFSWNDIGKLVSEYGVPLIFVYSVAQKSQNESMIALSWDTLTNPTLFRPSLGQSYDHVLEEDFAKFGKNRVTRSTTQPFDVFLQTVAKNLLKYTNPGKSDEEVVAEIDEMATFMRTLARGGIQNGTILPLESEVTLEQLQEWTQQQIPDAKIDWVEYLGAVFHKSGVKITPQVKLYHQSIERIYGTLNLVKQTDSKVLKNFALLRVFLFQAPDSDSDTRKAFEEYYQAKNYQLYPRWEYCTRKILDVVDTASLSYAVTYAYQKYHFNNQKLSQVSEMIENIRAVFKEILLKSDWMDESRDKALKKAENMMILLGYPDFVDDKNTLDKFYQNFRICEWDNYGNARTIRAFKQAYQFTQLWKLDRSFWGKSPFDANAYYNRPNNKIVVPISMLNPVFFYGDNPILDYSRLGSIIGHEITHGFDVNGKNYDQDGTMISWWSQQTMDAFNERTKCFKEQYSQYYVPEIDNYVNGSYCINENLADNGGIRESYKAFKTLAETQEIKSSGNYTLEQLFFIGYGTMWCSDESTYALSLILGGSYPPKRYRVIGSLSNMEEFSQAFNCPLGSTMNPEKKCQLSKIAIRNLVVLVLVMDAIKLIIALVILVTINALDERYLDLTVDPCDDFYQYACGNFKNVEPKPPNDPLLDLFTTTENAIIEIGKDILSIPIHNGDAEALKKAKTAYKSCLDTTNIDRQSHYEKPENLIVKQFGMPLVDNTTLTKISWTQIGEISRQFGVQQMFEFSVRNFNTEDYVLIMIPDSFNEPKMIRPEHIKTHDQVLQESFKNMAKKYKTKLYTEEDPLKKLILDIIKYLVTEKHDFEIIEELQKIEAFASQLFSGGILDDNVTAPGDILTLGQLQDWTETKFGASIDINWVDYFQALFSPSGLNITEDFVVYLFDPKSVYGILNLVKQTDPNTVQNFLLLRTFLHMAPESSHVIRNAFEEYYKALGLKFYDRPEYCTRKILDVIDSASLSFAVAHDYVNYHFNNNKIRNAVKLFHDIKKTFKRSLIINDWVSDNERNALIEKLDDIEIFLGYPEFITNTTTLDTFYENVGICEWDNYGNSQRIRAFKQAYSFALFNNHRLWQVSPFKVNAYAQRASNRILIPLSMFHTTFYKGDDLIYDYSRFGSTLGHELLHHFDSSGIHNNLNISLSDSETFKKKKQCLIDQFNAFYVPEIEMNINGELTLNENMADNGGLKLAYQAWRKVDGEKDAKLFFLDFAQSWCSQESVEFLSNLVKTNEHSPSRFRVLGIMSNLEEFSEAFNCPVGSGMNPEKKCTVW
ncbi:uncharacterized protein LOC123009135 [Tribolium madens]|uniref:uncharacterized protein LOC123009135 n=1 Tax=Tribolium madens TaxID=41895 RepID=UPI001CF72DB0|nr:uncharacterized protein LOC123009135 [Tribolium madens]